MDRRNFIKGAVGTAGLAGALSLLPPSLREAWATPAPEGGWEKIEHVVIFMQENRSFDHYYGTLPNVRGFGDLNTLQLSSGRSVFHQPGNGGVILPFATGLQNIAGAPHDAGTGHEAVAQGRYDGWVGAKSDQTMVHYDEASVAFYHQLAQAFTICDNYHCSVNGPTDPNRAYLFSGMCDNPMMLENVVSLVQELFTEPIILTALQTISLDSILEVAGLVLRGLPGLIPTRAAEVPEDVVQAITGIVSGHWAFIYAWPILQGPGGTAALKQAAAGLSWTAYAERLQQHGVDWKVYQEWDNYGDNSLDYFTRFRDLGRQALKYTDCGTGVPFVDFPGYYNALTRAPKKKADLDRALRQGLDELSPADRQLVQRGLLRADKGHLVRSIRDDIAAGTLPKVSWVVAPTPLCEHPSAGPRNGQALTHDILAALSRNPKIWNKTVFILNYDENDGYFDHIPGPVPPPDEPGEWVNGYNIGLGSRVPMLVVSPWTKRAVCSELFDHTSVLRFLERVTKVAEPNISTWRRTMCGDLSALFDFTASGTPTIPATEHRRTGDPGTKVQPVPAKQRIPAQSPGRTTRIPLPYRLGARAQQRPDTKTITITMDNRGHAATHYRVHPNAFVENFTPHRFDVGPGASAIQDYQSIDGRYDYTVYGADGFQRRFAGDLTQHGGTMEINATTDGEKHVIAVEFVNSSTDRAAFTVKTNAYRADGPWTITVPGGKSVTRTMTLDTEARGNGWYDLTVTLASDPGFLRRVRGYAETGARGVTANDPAPFDRMLLDRSIYEPDRDLVVTYAVAGKIGKHRLAVFTDPGEGTVDLATAKPVRSFDLPEGNGRAEVIFPVSASGKLQPGPALLTSSSSGSADGVPALPTGSPPGEGPTLPNGGGGLTYGVYILHHLDEHRKPLAQPVRFRVL
ncbi:alkaline phosphatase family protein [Nocardia alni]|uniref:alkaline phosphatase family protein n=1 Tax=Nocardia alni TaxID=2815723 RepID=UPI001C242D54|nr:alkaline phosphatase family protein [Nocardia alni]